MSKCARLFSFLNSPLMASSQLLQFLNSFPIPISQNHPNQLTLNNLTYSFHNSRFNWQILNKRSRFREAYLTDDNDDDDSEFDFKTVSKWWSDDEEDENEGLGFFQGAIALNWISKVFEAFGWMVPAVIISIVLGNGPDTIMMTLALPIAQSVFSLVSDKFFGRGVGNARRKSKSRKGVFGRGGDSRVRKRKRKVVRTGSESGDYKSWVAAENVKNGRRRDFGGWDELINEVKVEEETKYVNEDIVEEMIEISRRMKGDAPKS